MLNIGVLANKSDIFYDDDISYMSLFIIYNFNVLVGKLRILS